MKGMVLRSFADFVERSFGEDVSDSALSLDELSTHGAFTTVGYYPTADLVHMVTHVSEKTGQDHHTLIKEFGEDLFRRLASGHSEMMKDFKSPISLLAAIESVIHVNVRRLYTDTELPRFDVGQREGDHYLHLTYRSSRPFADLAEGLIHGCLHHYGAADHAVVTRTDLSSDGTAATFEIRVMA